jgi:hypothetical protein
MNYGIFFKELELQRRHIVECQNSLRTLAAAAGRGHEIADVVDELARAHNKSASAAPPPPPAAPHGRGRPPVFRAPIGRPRGAAEPVRRKKPGRHKNVGCARAVRDTLSQMGVGAEFTTADLFEKLGPNFKKNILSVTIATLARGNNPVITRTGNGVYRVNQNINPPSSPITLADLAR